MANSSLATWMVWMPGRSRLSRSVAYSPSGSCQKTTRRLSNQRNRCTRTVVASLIAGLKSRDPLQGSAELRVVRLHAVVQVNGELPGRQRIQHVVLVLLEV